MSYSWCNPTFFPSAARSARTKVAHRREWTENGGRRMVIVKPMQISWIEFGALTLLVSLLVGRLVGRCRQRRGQRSEAAGLPGHGFDATPIKQRLDHLRQDYVVWAALRPRKTPGHEQVVAAIRRPLTKLAYFRSGARIPMAATDCDTGEGDNDDQKKITSPKRKRAARW